MSASEWKGKIDVGIITIRDDEFQAVLQRFPDRVETVVGLRRYRLRSFRASSGVVYTLAIFRCIEQGNGEAHDAARDLIEDLDPAWLFVVGIAGGMPASEFSLGDVIVSTRITDFTVEAVIKDQSREYALSGGPLHRDAGKLVADIPAMDHDREFGDWNSPASIGMPRPPVELTTSSFYGSDDWRENVRQNLARHFEKDHLRNPIVFTGAIASSDRLVKDTELVESLRTHARQIVAVEMESAGIYRAAQGRESPFLAVRGISDIVGFKRHPDWTTYACHSAAAFLKGLLAAGNIQPRAGVQAATGPSNPAQGTRVLRHAQTSKTTAPSLNESTKISAPPKVVLAWLHVADSYWGAPTGDPLDQRVEMRALIKDVKSCKLHFERIFVTGDISVRGRPQDFDAAATWLMALAEAARVSIDAVRLVPGNHDVDRVPQLRRRILQHAYRSLRDHPDELERDFQDGEMREILESGLREFRQFRDRVLSGDSRISGIDWVDVLPAIPGSRGRVRIGGLCTVWISNQLDDVGRMVLGRGQLEHVLGDIEDDDLLLLLTHHTPSWLNPRCREWLRRYVVAYPHILHSSASHVPKEGPAHPIAESGSLVLAGRRSDHYQYCWCVIRWSNDGWELGVASRVFHSDSGLMRSDSTIQVDGDGFHFTPIDLSWPPPTTT